MQPVLLVNSPPGDPTQSYTSVPTLTGHLRRSGFSVEQRDLGIEILDQVLSEQFLSEAWTFVLESLPSLKKPGFQKRVNRARSFAEYVIENVEVAKAVMRDENEFYDLNRYRWATNVINLACDLASLPNHPSRLSAAQYSQNVQCTVSGLRTGTKSTEENFFAHVYEKGIVKDLLSLNPFLVGISITYHFQVIPGFTLARLIKSLAPNLPLVIGGAIVSRMESHLLVDVELFKYADYFVVGEGETALTYLATCLSQGSNVKDAPNLIRLKNGRPHASNTNWIENIKTTGIPDFDGLDFNRYLSPEPVFLLPASRGCYWGKCTFCDVSRQTRSVYRPFQRSAVIGEMKRLKNQYGARRFFFCDDAVPPETLSDVAKAVREELPDVTWQAEVRLEKVMDKTFIRKIAEGGCRQLMFGYESSSQRMLDKMLKSNRHELDLQIIKSCYDHGIAVNLQAFVGLPTETREEALSTVEFLITNEKRISSIGFGLFALWKETPIYNEPEAHGVTGISISLEHSLIADCDFETLSGLTREEAVSLCEEAKKRLSRVYRTRSHFLGGAAGAHTLLFLSKYSFKHLYEYWQGLDQPINTNSLPPRSLLKSAEITYFNEPDTRIAFVPQFAECVELDNMEATILDLADTPVSFDELLDNVYHATKIEPSDIANFIRPIKACQSLIKKGCLDFHMA